MHPNKKNEELSTMMNEMLEIVNKQPSQYYSKKAQEATLFLERTVYQSISRRFKEAEENVFLATQFIESDRNQLIREETASENVDRKEFYRKGYELYDAELKELYQGEI